MHVISGANGHVGSVAADILLQQNQKVRVIVRTEAKGAKWAQRGADVAAGSLEDPSFLRDALSGAAGFFALLPPNYEAADVFAWQCKTADTIAAAVQASGVPHVVLLSSIGADLKGATGPIKGLHYLEQALTMTRTTVTALRPGFFQENIAAAIGAVKAAGIYPNFFPSEDHVVHMIATKDIGNVVADSLLIPAQASKAIDLQGPAYTPKQVCEMISIALDKTVPIMTVPVANHLATLTAAGVPQGWAELYAEMYSAFAKGLLQPRAQELISCTSSLNDVIRKMI